MSLSHEHLRSKILAKIKIYILSRAELLCSLCYEIPCRRWEECIWRLGKCMWGLGWSNKVNSEVLYFYFQLIGKKNYRVSHCKLCKVILLCWGYRFWFLLIFWILCVHEIGTFMTNSSVFIFLMFCGLYSMINWWIIHKCPSLMKA